eukprot:TRINITY_DN2982_c1_g1_i1.p2 TRINITY_DN2982_c1_g1~~TRINITY_DN2982_c1_g1_i1.p2  ORF type:complete len:111 (-),score=12.29 TRINITY_DN2982_c1_g1_i1:463-795(-)
MEENFNKYWRETPMTLVATLDSRLKLNGVQIFLEEINNNLESENLNTFENLRSYLQSLFQFYCTQMGTSRATMAPQQVQQSSGVSWDVLYCKNGQMLHLKSYYDGVILIS